MTYTIQRQNNLGYIDEHNCIVLSFMNAYKFGLPELLPGDQIEIIEKDNKIEEVKLL